MPRPSRIIRPLATGLFRLLLRIFFRRVELVGLERLPAKGPAVLALNHPSGLVDPLFVLVHVPRRSSFLAKTPLFRMPVIGTLVRAFDSIPVHRRQDEGADMAKNRETFEQARRILASGGILAVFPEGTSHDDPKLKPLKTGGARIALAAQALLPEEVPPIQVVPAGLTFTDKGTFRSEVLFQLGEGFAVPRVAPGADGDPPPEAVRELTARTEAALAQVVLQAEQREALELAARAERVMSAAAPEDERGLAQRVELRRRLLQGHARMRARSPERLAELESRLSRYEAALRDAGLEPERLEPAAFTASRVAMAAARSALFFLLLAPAAALGLLLHWPVYALVRVLATRLAAGDESMLATNKMLASLLFYPLLWTGVAAAGGLALGPGAALLAPLVAAGSAYAALRYFEELDRFVGSARALAAWLFARRAFVWLRQERDGLRADLLRLGEELERAS